jgi:hypothetical protein
MQQVIHHPAPQVIPQLLQRLQVKRHIQLPELIHGLRHLVLTQQQFP